MKFISFNSRIFVPSVTKRPSIFTWHNLSGSSSLTSFLKKFLATLLFFLMLGEFARAQFKWLNPKPSGYSNNKMIFINRDTGFLFNANSELLQTVDSGNTWTNQRRFPGAVVMDLKDSTGVIAGYNGVLNISADNGKTWEAKSTGSVDNYLKVDVISRDTIILFNPILGRIFKTSNRGNTWQVTFTTLKNTTNVDFVSTNVGYASTPAGILKTTDGGISWQNVYSVTSTSFVSTIKFYDANNGLVFREFDLVLRTSDGGATWTSGYVNDRLYDFFYVDQSKIFAVAEYGMVYRSMDAGATWVNVNPGPRYQGFDLSTEFFFDADYGLVAGLRGRILKTNDGGSTFTSSSPTYSTISDISFGSNNVGYALNGRNIYKTIDKGKNWNKLGFQVPGDSYTGTSHCLFFSEDTGIVLSTYPAKLFKTTDGGMNWSVTPSGYEYYSGVSFVNSVIGFASMRTSYAYGLFKTTDGGNSWVEVGIYQNFFKIQFLTEFLGYASTRTSTSKLFRTVDGGASWNQVLELASGDIKAFDFTSPTTGVVAGTQGNLKLTRDGGQTWTSVSPSAFYRDFFTVKFFNGKVAFLTGEYNTILTSLDSGYTWENYNEFQYPNCKVITYTPDSSVFLAGDNGAILTRKIWPCILSEFTGAVNNFWNEPGNWSCGEVPNGNTDVIIPFGTVLVNGFATCRSVNLRPGANLVVNPGITFTILH